MADNVLTESKRTEIESFVADWLSDHRIPGGALAVVDADELLYAEGFGARNLERNEPATEDTLLGIGSSTKSFTATAIMQLAEDGDLSVDDPVDEYLGHLSDVPGEQITIRDLLTHTSGMPSDGSAGPLITRPLDVGAMEVPLSSKADFRRHVEGSADRRVTDRETFFYYNSGYTLLGEIIEEVTGDRFASYVEQNILAALGMDRSTFSREAFEDDDDRMTFYLKQDEETNQTDFPFDQLIHPPGGMVSSVTEMATYIRMYLNGGSLNGNTVLSEDNIDEMTTPVSTIASYIDDQEQTYGYGLMSQEFLDDRLVGHSGSVVVSNFWFGYLEEAEIGVAVGCTTTPETHPLAVGPAVLAILQGEDYSDIIPHYKLLEALERVTGSYSTYRGIGKATVEREGGTLTFSYESGLSSQELSLTPETIEEDLLVCETIMASGRRLPVRFELDGDAVHCYLERSRFVKET